MKVGEKVERLIEERGWSQSQLARKADSTSPTISRVVNGGEPSADLALRIARSLQVDLSWLVDSAADWPPVPVAAVHSIADCHDAAINFKRRIESIYREIQTAFDGLTKALQTDDKQTARACAKRMLDVCAANAGAIDEWYRFSARWHGIVVYSPDAPDWPDAGQIESTIVSLLDIDSSEIPQALRRWYVDCAEWIVRTMELEAKPVDASRSTSQTRWSSA